MPLTLYQWYTRDAAIAACAQGQPVETFCDGSFVTCGPTILCFVTLGDSPTESHAPSPSQVVWIPPPDTTIISDGSWLPEPVHETWNADRTAQIKQHYLLARPATSDRFLFLGAAHLGSGYAGIRRSALFRLTKPLPREQWLALGGSLNPRQPLAHLAQLTAIPTTLTFHHHTMQLLRLPPQRSVSAMEQVARVEYTLGQRLPQALREWYSLHGSAEILQEVAGSHTPALLEPDFCNAELRQCYAATGPSPAMIPIMYENQGVWHLAVPLDAGENPPVYRAYQEEPTFADAEWDVYADTFSDFLWAWTWDYLAEERDYCLDLSDALLVEDLTLIVEHFQRGPHTSMGHRWYQCETFERYYTGALRIMMMGRGSSWIVWLAAESAAALEDFLDGPWRNGTLRAHLGPMDIEMQKMYLK